MNRIYVERGEDRYPRLVVLFDPDWQDFELDNSSFTVTVAPEHLEGLNIPEGEREP